VIRALWGLCLVALVATGVALAAPGAKTLMHRAVARVHAKAEYRSAVLLEAEGLTSAQGATSAAGVVRWRFVFANRSNTSKHPSVFLQWRHGHFGKVRGRRSPFLEDQPIRVPRMGLVHAVGKLRAAGYTQPFLAVTLRKPVYPGTREPSYFFSLDGQYVRVGTRTGTVEAVS
jgi:hypothetical protein